MGYEGRRTDREGRDDVSFLNRPEMWPCWPVAPVKSHNPKHGGDNAPACGLVLAGHSRVVMLNMFQGWTPEQYKEAKKWEYDTIEALVADGWMVD